MQLSLRLLSVMLCSVLMSSAWASEGDRFEPPTTEPGLSHSWVEEFRHCMQGMEDSGLDRTEARQQCVALTLQRVGADPASEGDRFEPPTTEPGLSHYWVEEFRHCMQGMEDSGLDRTEARQQCVALTRHD